MDNKLTIFEPRRTWSSMSIPELRAYADQLEALANQRFPSQEKKAKEKREPLYVEAAKVRVYVDTRQ